MSNRLRVFSGVAVFLIFVLIAGCAPKVTPPARQIVLPPPLFPPQKVMQTGDYAGFFAENTEALKSCKEPGDCALALFNLSFVYCYAKSPYYNPQTALKYIEDLVRGAPESVLAYQAIVWRDNIYRTMPKKPKKRPAHGDSKVKETPDLQAEEPSKAESPQEYDVEADRQAMEEKIREQEETINKLNKQIERSREIDIEIEKKERGLLY
jgi:hypothetical protein